MLGIVVSGIFVVVRVSLPCVPSRGCVVVLVSMRMPDHYAVNLVRVRIVMRVDQFCRDLKTDSVCSDEESRSYES